MMNTIDAQLATDRQVERLAHARAYRLAKLARGRTRGGLRAPRDGAHGCAS
jgi:hypothetical protein